MGIKWWTSQLKSSLILSILNSLKLHTIYLQRVTIQAVGIHNPDPGSLSVVENLLKPYQNCNYDLKKDAAEELKCVRKWTDVNGWISRKSSGYVWV